MPDLWIVRTRPRDTDVVADRDALAILSEEERRRARGNRNAARRRSFIAARVALRTVLAPFDAGLVRGAPFSRGRQGKPAIAGGPEFSFSATDGAALIAISSEGPVGADIERVRDVAAAEAALRAIPALGEFVDRAGTRDGEGTLSFLRAWTRFEASLKFDGLPIGPALADLDPGWSGDFAGPALTRRGRTARAISDVDAGHGYVAACAHAPGAVLNVAMFDWRAHFGGRASP